MTAADFIRAVHHYSTSDRAEARAIAARYNELLDGRDAAAQGPVVVVDLSMGDRAPMYALMLKHAADTIGVEYERPVLTVAEARALFAMPTLGPDVTSVEATAENVRGLPSHVSGLIVLNPQMHIEASDDGGPWYRITPPPDGDGSLPDVPGRRYRVQG